MQKQVAEDMTFDMAVARISDTVFVPGTTNRGVQVASKAVGLAYGMSPEDVYWLAVTDAAIATHVAVHGDTWLTHYPEFCRGKGADYDETER